MISKLRQRIAELMNDIQGLNDANAMQARHIEDLEMIHKLHHEADQHHINYCTITEAKIDRLEAVVSTAESVVLAHTHNLEETVDALEKALTHYHKEE